MICGSSRLKIPARVRQRQAAELAKNFTKCMFGRRLAARAGAGCGSGGAARHRAEADVADRPPGYERYLSAGLTWALATLVFLAAGAWLGERLGSRAVGALVGAFVGGGAGFYWLIRQLTGGPGGKGKGGSA